MEGAAGVAGRGGGVRVHAAAVQRVEDLQDGGLHVSRGDPLRDQQGSGSGRSDHGEPGPDPLLPQPHPLRLRGHLLQAAHDEDGEKARRAEETEEAAIDRGPSDGHVLSFSQRIARDKHVLHMRCIWPDAFTWVYFFYFLLCVRQQSLPGNSLDQVS